MRKEKPEESWQDYVLRFEWHATYFKLVNMVLPKVELGVFFEWEPLDPVSFVALSTRLAVGRKFFAEFKDSILVARVATHILNHADMEDEMRAAVELLRLNSNKVSKRLRIGEKQLDNVIENYDGPPPPEGRAAVPFFGVLEGASIEHYSALIMNGLIIHADPMKTRALVDADPVDLSRTLIDHWIDIDSGFNPNSPDFFGPENAWEMIIMMLEIIKILREFDRFDGALDDPWPTPWQ